MDRRRRAARTVALMSLFSMTDTRENVPVASFDGDGSDLISLIVGIEPVQAGSGDPSPDNVRPISGWTGAKVTRTGINVWDEETEIGKLNTNTGADASSSAQLRTKNYVPVIGGKTYYFGTPTLTGSGQGMWILFYDDSKSVISGYTPPESVDKYQNAFRPQNRAMTVPANAKYFRFYLTPEYGATYDDDVFINYPSTYTSYSPYAGDTYTIQLGDTVYGGTLDVTTGKLTVDRANIASYNGETLTGRWISDRDVYSAGTTPTIGAQVVYKLATPIVYDLTPTQVTTLIGTNNIWADTGDIKYIEYNI